MEIANIIREIGDMFFFVGGGLVIGVIVSFVFCSMYFGFKCVIDDRKKR